MPGSVNTSKTAWIAAFAIGFSMFLPPLAKAETINQALAAAYNNNPTLNAQRAATRAADENIAIAKSGLRPTITADANIGLTRTRTSSPLGTSRLDLVPRGFGVTINQTLWDSYLTRNNINGAIAAVSASQEALRNAEQNILFNGASAYLDVLRDRAILKFRKQTLKFLNEQVRSERARFDVGEATRTDVAQAQASRAAAVAQAGVASANLQSSEAVYQQIVGKRPGRLSEVKGVQKLVPASLEAGIVIAVQEHPAIKSAEHIVDQADFNVRSAESQLLPRIDLQASQRRAKENGQENTTTTTGSVSAVLTVPIYQGGRTSATVRQNKEILGQRQIQVDESVDSVRAAVVSAYSQYMGARTSLIANQEQLKAAKLALDGAVEERKVGQRTTLDVLDTQTQVLNAQIALENSKRNLKVSGYAILSAIGRLDAKTLKLHVQRYDPNEHKHAVEDKWFGLRIPSEE